jgi:hypothetical protein
MYWHFINKRFSASTLVLVMYVHDSELSDNSNYYWLEWKIIKVQIRNNCMSIIHKKYHKTFVNQEIKIFHRLNTICVSLSYSLSIIYLNTSKLKDIQIRI